jgi:hypothetical protein
MLTALSGVAETRADVDAREYSGVSLVLRARTAMGTALLPDMTLCTRHSSRDTRRNASPICTQRTPTSSDGRAAVVARPSTTLAPARAAVGSTRHTGGALAAPALAMNDTALSRNASDVEHTADTVARGVVDGDATSTTRDASAQSKRRR